MAFETGDSFSPSIQNGNATGLIQFLPSTLIAYKWGITINDLKTMTAVQQLDYVEKYLQPYSGRLQTLGDSYMAVLWPLAIGQSDSYIVFKKGDGYYESNSGLDSNNKDGVVYKGEIATILQNKYDLKRGVVNQPNPVNIKPLISSVDPSQPTANPSRQYLTILGSGFVSSSQVTLRIGGSEYPIPSDGTTFISSSQIQVYVGLIDAGTWTAQVTNPGGSLSNIYPFQVQQQTAGWYTKKERAISHVPSHVFPKECFIWNDGSPNSPWRVIPGTGCAHWVAHQLGIKTGDARCYDGYAIRVRDILSGRVEVVLRDAKVGDVWTNEDLTHCGIVRQVGNGELLVEHDSSYNEQGVVKDWILQEDFGL